MKINDISKDHLRNFRRFWRGSIIFLKFSFREPKSKTRV